MTGVGRPSHVVELAQPIAQRLRELSHPSFSQETCALILLNRTKETSWGSLEVSPSKRNQIGIANKIESFGFSLEFQLTL